MHPIKRHAFTLIELLVVIAIIALLLSILIPGLSKAKDKTKDIICRSHIKGIGVSMLLYLNEYDSRAFDNRQSNGHLWYDDAGKVITPDNASWWSDAYWGLGYREYASDEKVFGCPSFVLKDMAELMYSERTHYQTTRTDLKHASGYSLNSYFFRDPDAPTGSANRNHRKISTLKSPSRFIVAHDHMEPKVEGDSSGSDQGDMFYIPSGGTFNLVHYRTGDRQAFYGGIFRHSKKSKSWDDPSQLAARLPLIDKTPNGSANVLFADGGVDKIPETTGRNISYSMYKGVGY
jgi:prepilin-type N-terminal cleavage/methylation domain-containing protein/prepilin-type processing-associated H-X9-DG protein